MEIGELSGLHMVSLSKSGYRPLLQPHSGVLEISNPPTFDMAVRHGLCVMCDYDPVVSPKAFHHVTQTISAVCNR